MIVALPVEKLNKLIKELKHWHKGRKSFNILQAAALMGVLQHVVTVCVWAKYLYMALQHSIAIALTKNNKELRNKSPKFRTLVKEIKKAKLSEDDIKKGRFAQGEAEKMVWHYHKKYWIIPSLQDEIALLIKVLERPDLYKWETPIAHLVRHLPDFLSWGEFCLYAAGGFSIDLKFWWQIDWPKQVTERTLKVLKNNRHGNLISINLLEFATIIINYAACMVAFKEIKGTFLIKYPVLLNMTDNTSSESWVRKACTSSLAGKALARVFCNLLLNNCLGINAEYLEVTKNDIADTISRIHKEHGTKFNFAHLAQLYPQLHTCCHFQPSQELLLTLIDALCSNKIPNLQEIKELGQIEAASATT